MGRAKTENKVFVIKVQRPLIGTLWFYYTEDRSFEWQAKPTREEKRLMGKDFKMYAEYYLSGKTLYIRNRIGEQSW
jgi:hypothetical protein